MVLGCVVHRVREDAHGRGAPLGEKGLEPKLEFGLFLEVECVDLRTDDTAERMIINEVRDQTGRARAPSPALVQA